MQAPRQAHKNEQTDETPDMHQWKTTYSHRSTESTSGQKSLTLSKSHKHDMKGHEAENLPAVEISSRHSTHWKYSDTTKGVENTRDGRNLAPSVSSTRSEQSEISESSQCEKSIDSCTCRGSRHKMHTLFAIYQSAMTWVSSTEHYANTPDPSNAHK